LSQFLKKELGLSSIAKKGIGIVKQRYSNIVLCSGEIEEFTCDWYKNDKFLLGLQEWNSGLDQDPWFKVTALLFKDACNDELVLLVRALVDFCHYKGIKMGKGRAKIEPTNITVDKDLY